MFGRSYEQYPEARELVRAYNEQGPYHMPLADLSDQTDETATEQIAAAYRFGTVGGRIDAVPAEAEPISWPDAVALYEALRGKLQALLDRLNRSNIDPHVSFSAKRLLDVLGTSPTNIRPGLVLGGGERRSSSWGD